MFFVADTISTDRHTQRNGACVCVSVDMPLCFGTCNVQQYLQLLSTVYVDRPPFWTNSHLDCVLITKITMDMRRRKMLPSPSSSAWSWSLFYLLFARHIHSICRHQIQIELFHVRWMGVLRAGWRPKSLTFSFSRFRRPLNFRRRRSRWSSDNLCIEHMIITIIDEFIVVQRTNVPVHVVACNDDQFYLIFIIYFRSHCTCRTSMYGNTIWRCHALVDTDLTQN